MIGRVAVVIVVLVVATITYPGALLTSIATRLSAPTVSTPAPVGVLPWLHVEHPNGQRPYIADEQNRLVILHGATPAGLLEFGPGTSPVYPIEPSAYEGGRCPSNLDANVIRYPPVCEVDIKSMASLGFNLVRLPISWSELEPERGHFNAVFLDRVAQIVDWARAARMYVLIDMHQNGFSHYVDPGEGVNPLQISGAPRWATITDGLPSRVYGQNREINLAVFEATNNFWYDRDGIQDEYIAAVAQVVRRFREDSVVAGFGLYNEPWIGWNLPPGFDDLLLFPFYRRVIDAVTGVRDGLPCWSGFYMPALCGYRDLGVGDRRHLMLLDTGLIREVTDFPTHLGLPVSSYPNVVLGLHAYTHIYTPDKLFLHQVVPSTSYPWGGYEQGWDSAEREAKAMDAALFLEEFGNNPEDDGLILTSQLREAQKHRVGFAFWTWKENGTWGVFDPPSMRTESSGCLRANREELLAAVYPRLSADPMLDYAYDSTDGSFILRAKGKAGGPSTVVYIPPEVTGAVVGGGAVSLVTSSETDGSRLVFATPTGGDFQVTVAAAPQRLTPCA
jgi:hypothetical protein